MPGINRGDFYRGKIMLAPMVRINTLPMRLLCLRYGAPIVYSEEIIDYKIINTTRVVNEELGTVDYLNKDGSVAFRTCEEEKSKLIFQVGTSDPERAVKALKHVENDVAAFDVNMGCPREFSVKGGMGAALLDQPELSQSIMGALVKNAKVPVSCKIRILPDEEKTLEFVRRMIDCNVDAVGIHGRFRGELSVQPCHIDRIRKVVDAVGDDIPIIASGGSLDIRTMEDAWNFSNECGTSSVMLARAAEWNPSIFSENARTDHRIIIKEYLELALKYDNLFGNSKYVISKMIGNKNSNIPTQLYNSVLASTTYEELCELFNVSCAPRDVAAKVHKRRLPFSLQMPIPEKITKLNMNVIENSVDIRMKELKELPQNPKTLLFRHASKNDIKLSYETVQNGIFFKCYLFMNDVAYTSAYLFKNKKMAEQASAKVCCIKNKILSNDDNQ